MKGDKETLKVGVLSKDKPVGWFAEEWNKALSAAEGFTTADITRGFARVISVKGKLQLSAAKGAGRISAHLFREVLTEEILDVVDKDMPIEMMTISEKVENALHKLESPELEFRMPPVLQSGGQYDLKWTAQTDEKNELHLPGKGVPAIHVATITAHNRLCCATVSRTLLFNANKDQSKAYSHLSAVFDEAVEEMKPGAPMHQIYDTITTQLKQRDPELLQHLCEELGWGLGYEVRERQFILDRKIKATFQTGMLVCLRVGLDNLETSSRDDQGKKYSLLLADTFIVTGDGAECITDSAFPLSALMPFHACMHSCFYASTHSDCLALALFSRIAAQTQQGAVGRDRQHQQRNVCAPGRLV